MKSFSRRPVRIKTSVLIILYLIPIVLFVFGLISIGLYSQLSHYIFERSSQYVGAVVNQIEWRLNSTLYSIDSSIQRLCNNLATQTLLYNAARNNRVLTNENMRLLRGNILESYIYAEEIDSIEIYGNQGNIYPGTGVRVKQVVDPLLLQQADVRNGAILWYTDENKPNHIVGVKKVLLPDYEYLSAGYLIVFIKKDFLQFLQQDFGRMEGGAIIVSDSDGKVLAQYDASENLPGLTYPEEQYDAVTTTSNYTNWHVTIYIPHSLMNTDVAWLNRLLFGTFSFGILLLACGGLVIARVITRPIKNMQHFMEQHSWPLVTNPTRYSNADVDLLNTRFNQLAERNNNLVEERVNEEHLRAKAELKALEAQVNPHFIINVLESIYWSFIGSNAPLSNENAQTILSLAKLFRYLLKAQDWISLNDELDFVRQYMQIEQFRFADRLKYNIFVENDLLEQRIPKLLIQPLVENAVKHGAETSGDAVTVEIRAYQEKESIVIQVKDNGVGISSACMETIRQSFQQNMPVGSVSSSYGLANLHKRLQAYYSNHAHLSILSNSQQKGTVVTITIDK